ncbi:MAG: L-threonylcarbamoyladenylate synthase [Solitalea-like symbiont of Tyrophagus putrescentiae]
MDAVKEAANYINSGKVILYPTDTIWGLGCDLFSYTAINKIYKIKKRPNNKGFILLINSINDIKKYIVKIPPNIYSIISKFKKPTTVILDNPKNLPEYIIDNKSLAFRITNNLFCSQVINLIGKPLISTSANIGGEQSPTNQISSVSDIIKQQVDYIALSEDRSGSGAASGIVHIKENGELVIIRN